MDPWAEVVANTRDEVGSFADGWIAATPGAIRELAATLADGTRAVLRLLYPHYEETSFRQEVAGLRMWDGRGIVRLLAWDEEVGAQFLESAEPRTSRRTRRSEPWPSRPRSGQRRSSPSGTGPGSRSSASS